MSSTTRTTKHPTRSPSRDQIWHQLSRASFAVLSYVTPSGQPRSSGVVYTAGHDRLYAAVAPTSWKALHIPATGQVAVTVPIRRGGLLSLLFPIPPATISFHARAVVHPVGQPDADSLVAALARLLPDERRAECRIVEMFPEDHFVTYGIGVPLLKLRDPAASRARIPVD